MNELLKVVLSLSLSGTLLILLLFLPRSLFKERLSKRWQYYIWLVVIARLLFPFAPETNLMARLFQGIDRPTEQMEIVSPYAQQSGIANTIQADETIHGQNNLHSEQMEPAKLVNSPNRNMVTMVWTNIWLGWLVMALILFIRKITVYQDFVKYIRASCVEVADIDLLERFGKLVERKQINTTVELYTNNLISSPLLIGFFRPYIILPTVDLSPTDFDYTILHELVHFKRRDMFYKWLVQFTLCIHWFNPFVYLMSREIGKVCELSCDEAVIQELDMNGRRAYGDTLLNAIGFGGSYKDALASVTLNENRELLKERLGAIMKYKRKSKATIAITSLLTILLTIGAISMGAYVASEISFVDNNANHFHNPIITEPISPDNILQSFLSESYYRDFYALMTDENYEISGTIYQNINPRSLVRFEKLSDTKLTVSGNMSLVEGEIKLVYKDEAGTLVTIAEGKAESEEPVSIFYEIETSEKGEI